MKEIQLQTGGTLRIDDEDFEEVSKYKWYYYKYKNYGKSGRGYLRAYVGGERRYIYMTHLIFGGAQHITYVIEFKDGDQLNWQRDNLRVFTQSGGASEVMAVRQIRVPECPFGSAKLIKAPSGRSDECTECDDYWNGPYYNCLDQARKTFWRGWRRIQDDNDRVRKDRDEETQHCGTSPQEERV